MRFAPIINLKIGWGWFEDTTEQVDLVWPRLTWELMLDDHPIDLPAYGTLDRKLFQGLKLVTLREWNIVLDKPTAGEHTLHYILRQSHPVLKIMYSM